MRKLWVIAVAAVIVGGVFLFDYWSSRRYPMVDFSPSGLPPLEIGSEKVYDYLVAGERAGTIVFTVESLGPYARLPFMSATVYTTRSSTSVERMGQRVELEALYVFSLGLAPLEYRLNGSLGGELQTITCLLDGGSFEGRIETEENVLEKSVDLPVGTVLVDDLMVAHWDLLFKVFTPNPGKRVIVNIYVPQILGCTKVELVADKNSIAIPLGGEQVEARRVSAPDLNLDFYLYGGELVRMDETEQEIVLILNR